MSLESFFGLETEGQGSPESLEQFQEQMRENARAIKNMSAHQAAQKKKENKLAQVVIRLMRDSTKSDLLFLVIKLLEENVPGAFILSILCLADAEMEKELRDSFKGGKPEESSLAAIPGEVFIPDEIKLDLNAWGEAILAAGLMMPSKTLEAVLTPDQKLKSLILDLLQFSLEEYCQRHGLEFSEDKIREVGLLSIQSVLLKLREVSQKKSDAEIIEAPL